MSQQSNKSKEEIIEERKANLPLPEQPPTASDWNSADARNVNVGSGRVEAEVSGDPMREPATKDMGVSVDHEKLEHRSQDLNTGRQL
jgi:hypothetical protein